MCLVDKHNAHVAYGRLVVSKYSEDVHVEAGYADDHYSDDLVRYEFADGSEIVDAGGAWVIEGSKPFSWTGLEGTKS